MHPLEPTPETDREFVTAEASSLPDPESTRTPRPRRYRLRSDALAWLQTIPTTAPDNDPGAAELPADFLLGRRTATTRRPHWSSRDYMIAEDLVNTAHDRHVLTGPDYLTFLPSPTVFLSDSGTFFTVGVRHLGTASCLRLESLPVRLQDLDPYGTLRGPDAALVLLHAVITQANTLLDDLDDEINASRRVMAPLRRLARRMIAAHSRRRGPGTLPSTTARATLITTWHNVHQDEHGHLTAMIFGFTAGDPLVPVHQFSIANELVPDDRLDLCESIFRLFNVGDDPEYGAPDEEAVTYRAQGNRSLSVGDVIQIGQHWFAVQYAGFAAVQAPAHLDGASQPGSTRIELPHNP